jgi:hypothetical protein
VSELHVTGDVEEFAAAAEHYLTSDPVGHTVPLTVLARLRPGHTYDAAPRFPAVATLVDLRFGPRAAGSGSGR